MEESTKGTAGAARKRTIWLVSTAVVLIALIAGGLVWHQSPSFCGAVCHTPMGTYVKGYHSGDATLLITKHAEGAKGLKCLDCHEATVGQQVKEATSWVSGAYGTPLETRQIGTRAFCLKSGCHDDAKLVQATKDFGGAKGYNPHDPRHGKLECYRCHTMHQKSVLACNQCHKLQLPQGWVAPARNGVVTR